MLLLREQIGHEQHGVRRLLEQLERQHAVRCPLALEAPTEEIELAYVLPHRDRDAAEEVGDVRHHVHLVG